MILDGRSLINEIRASQRGGQMEDVGGGNQMYLSGDCREVENTCTGGYGNVINDTSDGMFNCNTFSSSNSRFTNEIHSRRAFSCNKENSVSIMDHNTDVNHCKNVNMCNISELNKNLTSLVHLSSPHSTSSCEALQCSEGDRCEIDVR